MLSSFCINGNLMESARQRESRTVILRHRHLGGDDRFWSMKSYRVTSLSGVFFSGASVQTNTAILGNAPSRAAAAPEMVALYRTAAQVPGKYQEVALLFSDGTTGWTSEAGMLKSMRTRADASCQLS